MSGWPEGVGRVVLEEIDSTNAEAARRAAAGAPGPEWIMARRQTAGRGRQGKPWVAPEGNLNATLLVRPHCETRRAAQLSFAACLAVADLFAEAAPTADIRLKWPNDALINGRKAAGVLLESAGRGLVPDWMAIGIGINLVAVPEGALPGCVPATSLVAEGGRPLTPEQALDRLAPRFEHWRTAHAVDGFQALRAAWLARATGLGQRIEARLPDRVVHGIYEDVDADGNLVLNGPTGRQRISAADLVIPG